MKEKSSIEKKAQEKQTDLLSKALSEASNAGGHWLNASGKKFPRLYPQGVSASPFNALFMALHSDRYAVFSTAPVSRIVAAQPFLMSSI